MTFSHCTHTLNTTIYDFIKNKQHTCVIITYTYKCNGCTLINNYNINDLKNNCNVYINLT